MASEPPKVFISYNRAERDWAEWIAGVIERGGYQPIIQAWDFRPGQNFVLRMRQTVADADITIAVLSETYLKSEYTQPEWSAVFARDPTGEKRQLIPVRVENCAITGLLRSIIYIDLVDLDEQDAERALLDGLKPSGKPAQPPAFPAKRTEAAPFPGSSRNEQQRPREETERIAQRREQSEPSAAEIRERQEKERLENERRQKEEQERLKTDQRNERVVAHGDVPAIIDQLGRDTFAEVISTRIKEVWKARRPNRSRTKDDAFMIHIQGPWGSGKTSILNFLRADLKKEDVSQQQDKKKDSSQQWVIVDFNAWRYQRIRPPWWTLIREIYVQSVHSVGFSRSLSLRACWCFWRVQADWLPVFSALVLMTMAVLLASGVIKFTPHQPAPARALPSPTASASAKTVSDGFANTMELGLKVVTACLVYRLLNSFNNWGDWWPLPRLCVFC